MTIAEMLLKEEKSERNFDETESFVKAFKEIIKKHEDIFHSFNHGDMIAEAKSYDNGQDYNTHFTHPFKEAALLHYGPFNEEILYPLLANEGVSVRIGTDGDKYVCITFFLI